MVAYSQLTILLIILSIMEFIGVKAESISDSRNKPTILISVITSKGKFKTSAPSGKSTGIYEVKSYKGSINSDIKFINNLKITQ